MLRNMKLWKAVQTITGLFLAIALVFSYAEAEFDGDTDAVNAYELPISAECAILVDSATGRVLYEKNADQRHLIASTTKILTALVVLKYADDLDAQIEIPLDWEGVEGSSMYLEPGDVVSIRGLLYGLMLQSGNDAAVILANAIAGSESAFVVWMNEYATQIGMYDSHFQNPHGLDFEEHYSTAHDMAILMIDAMKNDVFRELVHTRFIEIDGFELYYHNKLLDLYEYCIGGKTGYTMAAGRTLVTASDKEGHQLVAVTLNAPDDWNDQIALFEYGYSNYFKTSLSTTGSVYCFLSKKDAHQAVPVYYANTIEYTVNSSDKVEQDIYLDQIFKENVPVGAIIGRIDYCLNGENIGTSYLLSGSNVNDDFGEVSLQWNNDFKNTYRLAGLYPDGQPSGTYRMEGLLSTALWHSWG